MITDRARWAGGVAAVAAVLGTAAVSFALGVLPHPWTRGYVSEGGVAASPRDGIYRLGILALAASLVLLGVALRRLVPFVFGLLVTGGAFGGVSAAVSCTPGCPLPPYERSTPTDLVHAGASIAAVALAVLAMGCVGLIALWPALRRTSMMIFVVSLPLMLLLAFGLLAVGRGMFTSVLERVALATVVVWMALTGIALLRGLPAPRAAGERRIAAPTGVPTA